MQIQFLINLIENTEIQSLPDAWTEGDLRDLLAQLEVDEAHELPAADLLDMVHLELQDRGETAAAEAVLTNRLSDLMVPGQAKHAAQELRTEPLWEEYPELEAHHRLFICAELLSAAFPGVFLPPSAHRLGVEVTAQPECRSLADPVEEALALRLIAAGMDESSLLNRLYAEPLAQGTFPEAAYILWECNTEYANRETARLEIITSGYWLRGFPEAPRSYSTKLDFSNGAG